MNNKNKHLSNRVLVYAVIWAISYAGSLSVLNFFKLPQTVGILITIISALAFVVFIYKYYRNIFFMDEMQIKVQLEAVAIAFALGLFLIVILSLLDLVVALNNDDWSYRHMVPYFVLFYFVGLFISKKKYSVEDEKHD